MSKHKKDVKDSFAAVAWKETYITCRAVSSAANKSRQSSVVLCRQARGWMKAKMTSFFFLELITSLSSFTVDAATILAADDGCNNTCDEVIISAR